MQVTGTKAHHPPLFLIVTAGLTAIAIALPLTYLVIRVAGVGGERLLALVLRPRNLTVLLNSVGIALVSTLLATAIALPIAFLTMRTNLPWRRFWLIATTLPLAVPDYVGGFALIAAFGPKGSLLQLWLEPLGVQELPEIYGWTGAILGLTLFSYPYLLLSIQAGWQGIDPAIEEVARSLGYTQRQTFFRVTLPALRPSIIAGGLLVALNALQDFGTTSVMRFDTFTRAIFLQYRYTFDRHQAAALALMLVSLVLLLLWLEYKARSRAAYYTRATKSYRPPALIDLGIWQVPAILFCLSVVSLGLLLPIGVTSFWLLQGLIVTGTNETISLSQLMQLAWNSMVAAGLAAIAATFFALPIAILAVRFPSRITTAIERCSYIGFGLPGIVVAFSLVFWGANYLPWLYQTLPMLIFAYLVLFVSQSVGTVRSSLLQVNPNLEESAQSLGKTPWQTLIKITLPLVSPGILGGGALVFLTAIKELPVTLLLAPIGFNTLATHIWKATESVSYSDAAAAALVLLVVSISATLFVLSQSRYPRLTIEAQRSLQREVD
ncbi:iron ABC transporter permease [Nostocaceae cyanobacterium CENA357]|uniref:Iron ABC transporter permease n=1 Tax=Atlanticothrix silvestris CENA357 TaxID=1725252 RepID=A0A8J7HBH4_9CYAN|nr:iron ABC transporter permease [Atlanticothrix silvestris]MBH8553253.1 iron ABC transporter permease [Atlanticothrix silvestris CENA357]